MFMLSDEMNTFVATVFVFLALASRVLNAPVDTEGNYIFWHLIYS